MGIFDEKYGEFLEEFGRGRKMVLSTAVNDHVFSRMMSVVRLGGDFMFQTDRNFRKYEQLTENPNAALCIDNIQIEGVCREWGRPLDNRQFREAFRECFEGSYKAYSGLDDERLFVMSPTFIERWVYIGKSPFVERFDVAAGEYSITGYEGK